MRTLCRCAAALLAVAVGCGGQAVVSKPLDSVDTTKTADIETRLSGKLVGHDGKPILEAHVHAGGSSHQVGDDGSFLIEVDEPFVTARFTGVDHAEMSLAVVTVNGSVKLDVQLGTYPRPEKIDSLSLAIYELPVREGTVPRPVRSVVMSPKGDGVFSATIESDADQVGYHVSGLAINRSINGPQSDSLVYDNGGDYISVVKVTDGKAAVTIDTRKLLPGGAAPKVSFAKPESTAARVARAFLDGDHKGYRDEKNEWVKTAKLLAFLTSRAAATEPEMMAEVLMLVVEEVPVDSPLWEMAPNALFPISMSSDQGLEYAEKVAGAIEDPDKAAQILLSMLFSADRKGDAEMIRRLQKRLKEDYPGTPYALQADRFDPDRKVMAGKNLPAFDYEEWGGARRLSPATFKGKQVVIKFWATWCKPCIAEMDELHKLWESKKGADFALVSISINDSAEAFEKFRKNKWPMPWTNIFLDRTQSADAMKMWEIVGIPKTIKADKDGIIREVTVGGSI